MVLFFIRRGLINDDKGNQMDLRRVVICIGGQGGVGLFGLVGLMDQFVFFYLVNRWILKII